MDAVGTQYAAGSIRSTAARKAVDGILNRLGKDTDAILGDRSAAFSGRVEKTMGEAQLFASHNAADAQLLLDASVKPDPAQKAWLEPLLAGAAERVKQIEAANPPDALTRRHEVGFSTRAAARRALTPEQQKAFDGPFEAVAKSTGAAGPNAAGSSGRLAVPPPPRPESVPATPTTLATPAATAPPAAGPGEVITGIGSSEAKAVALARLEAMRYAALEGPFAPEVKVSLAQRVAKGRSDILQVAAGPAGPAGTGAGETGADERVSRLYSDVLADAAKLLRGQAAEFLRRQNRIYQDVSDLSGDNPWAGRAALEGVKLTAAQKRASESGSVPPRGTTKGTRRGAPRTPCCTAGRPGRCRRASRPFPSPPRGRL